MKKRENYILLEPTSEIGKSKIAYHGEKWFLVETVQHKFVRSKGMCHVCRSRDGSKIIYVQVTNDKDFKFRKC